MATQRFPVQPARQLLYNERWSIPSAAQELNIPTAHLFNCLRGNCPPAPEVRDRLPALLHRPLTELFTADALAAQYGGPRGAFRLARASEK